MNEGEVRSFIFESYKKGRSVGFVKLFLERNGINVSDWSDYIDSLYIKDRAQKRARILAACLSVAAVLLSLTYSPVYIKADLSFNSIVDFAYFNELYFKPFTAFCLLLTGLVILVWGKYITYLWFSIFLALCTCITLGLSFLNSNLPGMVAAGLVIPLLVLITEKKRIIIQKEKA